MAAVAVVGRLPAAVSTAPTPARAPFESEAAVGSHRRPGAGSGALAAGQGRINEFDEEAEALAAKAHQLIASHSIDAVSHPGFGWVTVFGYGAHLDALDLLTTSLLSQARATMRRYGSPRDASGRSRARSFRRAFLI